MYVRRKSRWRDDSRKYFLDDDNDDKYLAPSGLYSF